MIGIRVGDSIEECLEGMDGRFIIVFASPSINVVKLRRELMKKKCGFIGCTTAGEIFNRPLEGKLVCVYFEDRLFDFYSACVRISDNERKKGREVIEKIFEKRKSRILSTMGRIAPEVFLTLVSGVGINGNEFALGMKDAIGNYPGVAGGSAGDNLRFKRTFVFCKEGVFERGAVVSLLRPTTVCGIGVGHGWKPFSEPMVVTKARGNIVYKIDNKPAIKIYESYFGKRISELKKPLGNLALTVPVGIPDISGVYRLRHPIIARKDGSIVFSGSVPEGAVIRLMQATEKSMISAAKEALNSALSVGIKRKEVECILVFDCAARKMIFKDPSREIKAIRVGKAPVVGFYTYGEYGPLGGNFGFLNETIVVLVISKKPLARV